MSNSDTDSRTTPMLAMGRASGCSGLGLRYQRQYVAELGCPHSVSHGVYASHKCLMWQDRAACLRELRRAERERRILKQLCSGRLPAELVLRILGALAANASCDDPFEIFTPQALSVAAHVLLGETAEARGLHAVMEEAILESATIDVRIRFKVQEHQGFAILPSELPSRVLLCIRHLSIEESCYADSSWYSPPDPILTLTACMASVAEQLPHLDTLILKYRVAWNCAQNSQTAFARPCRIMSLGGSLAEDTYGAVLEKLIDAIRQVGRRQRLELTFNGMKSLPRRDARPIRRAIHEVAGCWVDQRPAVEILKGLTWRDVEA